MNQPIPSPLLGGWRILRRLTAGIDDREPDDDDKYLWFLADILVTGDDFAAWDMPYSIAGSIEAGTIDVHRDDLNTPWLQRGIFAVSNDRLVLCMSPDPVGGRPTDFSSTPENGAVYYEAERTTKPPPRR
jgi:hypothetical protein